jgi:hypothetical protein
MVERQLQSGSVAVADSGPSALAAMVDDWWHATPQGRNTGRAIGGIFGFGDRPLHAAGSAR